MASNAKPLFLLQSSVKQLKALLCFVTLDLHFAPLGVNDYLIGFSKELL